MPTPNPHHPSTGPNAAPTPAPSTAAQQQVAANVDHDRTDTQANVMNAVGAAAAPHGPEHAAPQTAEHSAGSTDAHVADGASPHSKADAAHTYGSAPAAAAVSGPQNAINSSVPYVGLAAATGLVAGASGVAALPILGKIPYLPQVAGAIQNGLGSLTGFLGMNTGTLATNATLQSLPALAGPSAVGALSLWLLGKANEKLTGRTATGLNIFKTMWNGVRAPVDLPIKGLQKLGDGISWASGAIFGNKTKKGLIGKTFGLTKSLIANNYKAALAGTAAAIFIAPATGGSSLIWGLTGFVATKLLSKTPAAGGGAAVPDAHAH